ncbi:MAG: hypothetical protein WC750_02180 [Patescibacteria group bacterium]|jgi:hypothetical protein
MECKFNEFYTESLELALEALQKQIILRTEILRWIKCEFGELPDFIESLASEPSLILAPHVATARYDAIIFALEARRIGLRPVFLEYTNDDFVTCSPFKLSLVRMRFISHKGRNGGLVYRTQQPLDILPQRSVPIGSIFTREGDILPTFHHKLQDAAFGSLGLDPPCRLDISSYFLKVNIHHKAKAYYRLYMALWSAFAILYEDFHGDGEESGAGYDRFTQRIVEPAWQEIRCSLNIHPLIVRKPWVSNFSCYLDPSQEWRSHGIIPPSLSYTLP